MSIATQSQHVSLASAPTEAAPVATMPLANAPKLRRRHIHVKLSRIHFVFLSILVVFIAFALFAPMIAPHNPVKNSLANRLVPPVWIEGGSWKFPLGTDQMGRDVLSRIIFGARISLLIATAGTLFGTILGAMCGLLSGYLRGRLDSIMMLIVDAYIALPFIIIALSMVAILGTSLWVLILLAILSGFASYTRITRGLTMQTSEQLFVLASRSIGAGQWRILTRHLLPNVMAPIIVLTTMEMTSIVLLEASLSFLGFGIQPPTPAWGLMVSEGRDYLHTAWWVGVFPGISIMLLALSISMLGDWLRDALDPKSG